MLMFYSPINPVDNTYVLYVLDFRSLNRYGKQTNKNINRVRVDHSLYTCHFGVEINDQRCSETAASI